MKAIVITKPETGYHVALTQFPQSELMEGDVVINVQYSALNYKDGLALTGKSPVVRRFPMIAGIDASGIVESSSHTRFKAGDKVILNGFGCGETHLGAYAQKMQVKGDWLIKKPRGLTLLETMQIGTAGYTAMLCVNALEEAGLKPAQGPVLVTGASGGVGTVAISLLSRLGYEVIASTGRMEEADFLKSLGASQIIDRAELSNPAKPLMKERFAGAVDAVGSHTLANVIAQIKYGGAVAACGLAQGMDLPTSVAPFILRGVRLLGVDSVMCPLEKRQKAWSRLAKLIDKQKLTALSTLVPLEEIIPWGEKILNGQVRGRVAVKI